MKTLTVNLPDVAARSLEDTAKAQGVCPVVMLARLVIVSLVPQDERDAALREMEAMHETPILPCS